MPTTQLRTAPLGTTGLEITRIGFGAWAIGGGGWEAGWGPQDDDESIAAIYHALEHGINWIDTAGAYGFGHSERVVGRALEGVSELAELKKRGLVRHIGVSNFEVEQPRRIQGIAPVETLQPPYSLIARE